MLTLILGMFTGLICGVISGLIPGIHSNTVAGIIAGVSPFLLPVFGPEGLVAVLISLLISHLFVENIPSAFFGIPDAGSSLSVLPAHSLTLEGKGEEAVRLSALGCLYGISMGIPVSVVAYFALTPLQGYIDWMTATMLVSMMGLIIIHEEFPLWALLIFLCSGVLGIFAFTYDYLSWSIVGENSILMPLLTGLFGLSVILTSSQGGSIPHQTFYRIKLSSKEILSSAISGTLSGLIVGWLPGLSTASANAVIHTRIRYDTERRRYLVAAGAATTANAIIGIAAFYGIDRTRNGVMVVISSLSPSSFPTLLTICITSSLVAYLLVIRLSKVARVFSGINARNLNTCIGGFVIVLSGVFTGPFGLLILLCATSIGYTCSLLNLSRVTCMGAVTIPVILYSIGYGGF